MFDESIEITASLMTPLELSVFEDLTERKNWIAVENAC